MGNNTRTSRPGRRCLAPTASLMLSARAVTSKLPAPSLTSSETFTTGLRPRTAVPGTRASARPGRGAAPKRSPGG